jgi:DNA-binding PadR family transcriptional regulator
MDHEKILRLDSVIHAPVRLAVLSILITVEHSNFSFLKEATGTTDGNLSTHLAKLENHGLVAVKKKFVGKKPQTFYTITDRGRTAFTRYLEQLEQIVEMEKNRKRKEKNRGEGSERRKGVAGASGS